MAVTLSTDLVQHIIAGDRMHRDDAEENQGEEEAVHGDGSSSSMSREEMLDYLG